MTPGLSRRYLHLSYENKTEKRKGQKEDVGTIPKTPLFDPFSFPLPFVLIYIFPMPSCEWKYPI